LTVTGKNTSAWGTLVFKQARTLVSGETYHLRLTAPEGAHFRCQTIGRGSAAVYGFHEPTYFGDGSVEKFPAPDGGSVWQYVTDEPYSDMQFYFTLSN
jgi:hypothetical protein